MNFEYHLEKIEFEVFPDSHYNIILGLLWFRTHNSTIIWDTEEINTKQCNCPRDPHETDLLATHDYNWYQRIGLWNPDWDESGPKMNDKLKTNYGYTIEHISMKDMKKEIKCQRSRVFTCLIQPIKMIIQNISEKYCQFKSLFNKAKGLEALPKH